MRRLMVRSQTTSTPPQLHELRRLLLCCSRVSALRCSGNTLITAAQRTVSKERETLPTDLPLFIHFPFSSCLELWLEFISQSFSSLLWAGEKDSQKTASDFLSMPKRLLPRNVESVGSGAPRCELPAPAPRLRLIGRCTRHVSSGAFSVFRARGHTLISFP